MKLIYSFFFLFSFTFFYAQTCAPQPKVLIAGDSWAQYMSDDGTHNVIFDKFGHPDFDLLGPSLGANPGPGYTGTEYAISGSEAREWADMVNYPWIDNVINEITNNPTIETVILSIGGNDILAAKSGGGWYKDMDLDTPGSEAALFETIRDNTFVIIDEILAVHPTVEILISSYDYPNFNTSFCFLFACPKRDDLSRDPSGDLITDTELNQMMITVEEERISWLSSEPNLKFDNAIGLSHYYYGDGVNAPGTLPLPEQTAPFTANFYGGNISLPSLRSNFRNIFDPIHLNSDAYRYKIIHQTLNYFMPKIREDLNTTLFSSGGTQDGWTNGATNGTTQVRIGDDGAGNNYKGILNFDSSSIPDDAVVDRASIYLIRNNANSSNPFTSGALGEAQIDVKSGSFGTINIENSDYSEAADASDAGCFHGTVSANDYALRIDLNPAGMAAINLLGNTQFRISFPNTDVNADYIDFNTGDANLDADFTTVGLAEYMSSAKPFIDIHYTSPLSVTEHDIDDVILYPNPVKSNFKIKGLQNNLYNLQIITAQGQVVKEVKNFSTEQPITTENLANGFYFLRINSENSYKTMKFLKTN